MLAVSQVFTARMGGPSRGKSRPLPVNSIVHNRVASNGLSVADPRSGRPRQ